jgi:hypothetical protein
MLDTSTVEVLPLEARDRPSSYAATIRIKGRPHYDPEERWEIDVASEAGMLPVETRFYSADGTLTMKTTAIPSSESNRWFPQEVLIEAFKDGTVRWRERYAEIATRSARDGMPSYATVPPGTHVEDHRLPVPVTYTVGNRPPTPAELQAMQTNAAAATAYMWQSTAVGPPPRPGRRFALAALLAGVIAFPFVFRLTHGPRAATWSTSKS